MKKQTDIVKFHILSRQKKGTSSCKTIRKNGKIPCNVYGLGKKSILGKADAQGLKRLWKTEGDTGLIYLQIDEKKKLIPVLIEEIAYSSIGKKILHVSFKRVNLDVKIEAEVSVTVVGEAKIDQAVTSLIKDTVLVKALPADLPDNFELDVSSLTEVGQNITLADLVFDKAKVELILDNDEDPKDIVLVSVQAVKEEVEPEEIKEDESTENKSSDEAKEETKDEDSEKTESEEK